MTRDYYFGFFQNSVQVPFIAVIISTSESQPVNYSIEAPGVGYYTSGSVTSDNEVIINLPTILIASSHNDHDKGIHLMTSSGMVTVIGQNLWHNSTDTFLCLPIINLRVEEYVYYGISVPMAPGSTFNSYILVVGTEDNTMIKLTVTQPVTIRDSTSPVALIAGMQYSFVINRFQTVLIGSVDDLTGTKIVTNKPVSVLSGHQCAQVNATFASCDYLIEQVPPTTVWGRVFYLGPPYIRNQLTIKVLAAYNSTSVDIYCTTPLESYVIAEGESVTKYLSNEGLLREYCTVKSSKAVLVVLLGHGCQHDGTGNILGDPFMAIVPATNQYDNKIQLSTLRNQAGYQHIINVIVLAEYYQLEMISLIYGGINIVHRNLWQPVMINNATEAYSFRKLVPEGVVELTHSNEAAMLTAVVYGYYNYSGYGHPGGITYEDFHYGS